MAVGDGSLVSPFLQKDGARPPQPAVQRVGSVKFFERRQGLKVENYGLGSLKFNMYWQDFFHTLVNMPPLRFFLFFLSVYLSMYVVFAALYFSQPVGCISKTHNFLQYIWFSVHTSATIGYGHMAPHPTCTMLNAMICCQVLASLWLQACLLGVIYARFSTPNKRAHTIRFSSIMTLRTSSDGNTRLSFRLANLRKHQLLQPELRMLLLRKLRHGGMEEFVYTDLPTRHAGGGRLWLGVPTVLYHVIDDNSPLHRVSLEEMGRRDWELVVLLDGIDESTSTPVQARHSYRADDIRWDARFEPMIGRRPSGFLGVDFSSFDLAAYHAEGSSEEGSIRDGKGKEEAHSVLGMLGAGEGSESHPTATQSAV